jgi:serine/threonine protein kinase
VSPLSLTSISCGSFQVIHRDLKLENILLSTTDVRQMVPKIADFGLSAIVSSSNISAGSSQLPSIRQQPLLPTPLGADQMMQALATAVSASASASQGTANTTPSKTTIVAAAAGSAAAGPAAVGPATAGPAAAMLTLVRPSRDSSPAESPTHACIRPSPTSSLRPSVIVPVMASCDNGPLLMTPGAIRAAPPAYRQPDLGTNSTLACRATHPEASPPDKRQEETEGSLERSPPERRNSLAMAQEWTEKWKQRVRHVVRGRSG